MSKLLKPSSASQDLKDRLQVIVEKEHNFANALRHMGIPNLFSITLDDKNRPDTSEGDSPTEEDKRGLSAKKPIDNLRSWSFEKKKEGLAK